MEGTAGSWQGPTGDKEYVGSLEAIPQRSESTTTSKWIGKLSKLQDETGIGMMALPNGENSVKIC